MARQNNDILGIEGRIGSLTAYVRNGKKYWRVAHNRKNRRLSRKQLAIRERQSHNNALWRALKETEHVYIEGGENTTYNHFMSINMNSPVPYFTKDQYHSGLALLLPNMVLSDGPLPSISYQLGEIDNPTSVADAPATIPALLTDLTPKEVQKGEYLLYVLQQAVISDDMPYLYITVEPLTPDDFTIVPSTLLSPYKNPKGTLALVGERFSDPMLGFGLVCIKDGHASRQHVVTRCSYYERYTTEEALLAAAKSYGGLTG
jgi:hypothetical protein